jgi:hypothetical protein
MTRSYVLRTPTGFRFDRRAVGFLEYEADIEMDAGAVFDGLEGAAKQAVRTRLDHWLEGNVYDKYFHGFPNQSSYKHCFTVKWHVKRQEHRLYGFLCNAKPQSDARFQLCVLIYYAPKNEMGTDYAILDRVNQLRLNSAVTAAIAMEYREYGGGMSKWRN